MKSSHRLPRRDRLHLLALRAHRLTDNQSIAAWTTLVDQLDDLSTRDIPKFEDLFRAIRLSIISAKHAGERSGQNRPSIPAGFPILP